MGGVSTKEGKTRDNNEGIAGNSSGKSLLSVCISNLPWASYKPILACRDSSNISKLFFTTASIKRDCKRFSLLTETLSSCKKGSIWPKIWVANTSERMLASLSCTSCVNRTIATANKTSASMTLANSLAKTERKPNGCIKWSQWSCLTDLLSSNSLLIS